ncbi:MAG TPA: penicillin acylase family protein, partial [Herpetosiphonaceae bacterium]
VRAERIRVKGAADVHIEVRESCWGPVLRQPLLDQPIALHWTALDPQAVEFGLLHMDDVQNLDEAIDVMQRYAGPPMNVMLADADGRIAWTTCGKIPSRHGFDGALSHSWAGGDIGWRGYLPPAELPLVVDPPAGYLATANNRTTGKDYPHVLGHNYPSSYRAYRIGEQVQAMRQIEERDMLALQLDTTSAFFERYRSLVLELLTDAVLAERPALREARDEIAAWDGAMNVDSRGIALLAELRGALIAEVFKPYLRPCQQAAPSFIYYWFNPDTPLLQLLNAQIPATLPEPERYADWNVFLLDQLEQSSRRLLARHHVSSLTELTWGRVNTVTVAHPLGQAVPLLGKLLNMPRTALSGGEFCVLVAGVLGGTLYGPTMRMIVAPSRETSAILHMPGGQSGNPLSSNYRDQQHAWAAGLPLPFAPGPATRSIRLIQQRSGS